jgi:hypothetical protein
MMSTRVALIVAMTLALAGCDNVRSDEPTPIEIEVDLDGKTHTKTVVAPPVVTSTYRAPVSTKRTTTTPARTTTRATRATR